jgi:hypothetical protein
LNEYLSIQSQQRPALRRRSPYGEPGEWRRQQELVTSPAQAEVNGSTVIIDATSHDTGAAQHLGDLVDPGQYLSGATFLPRDEAL